MNTATSTQQRRVLDRIAAKQDDEPLADTELEVLFTYEFSEPFETREDGSWV